jgi:DNA polymerase-1
MAEQGGPAWTGLSLSEKAKAIRSLALTLRKNLEALAAEQGGKHTVVTLLRDIELPLVPVLFAMEEAGVLLDPAVFEKLSREIDASVKSLEA